MIKLPKVIGLTLCERLAVDPPSGRASLVGVFNSRHFSIFPTHPFSFTVYVALYGGVGEGTMELVINQLETEEDIYSYKRWVAFTREPRIGTLEIKVTKCIFPAPGRYDLVLRFDNEELTRRYLDIFQE